MIDRLIDDIERSIHFLFLFWENNPIYLVCSVFYYVISSLLLGGTTKSFLIVFVVYAVSLIIGFSSLGEKFVNDNIRMYKKWNLIMYKNVHR